MYNNTSSHSITIKLVISTTISNPQFNFPMKHTIKMIQTPTLSINPVHTNLYVHVP